MRGYRRYSWLKEATSDYRGYWELQTEGLLVLFILE